MPEDNANYCYTVISVPRVGDQTEEFWNVKIEESGCANEGLIVEGWGHDKAGAGELLYKSVMEHVCPIERANNINIKERSLFDPSMITYHSEYMVSKEHSEEPEDEWFWWDIVEVKLEPVKTYDIINAEYEKARVEDMKEREKEGLEMARRSRGELTEEEREEIEARNARMGVVHELDRNDPDIMGLD
jgi:hypothetical protein